MLNNLFQNIGKIFGMDVPSELGFSADIQASKYLNVQTKGAEPLSKYLSYRYFDQEEQIFFNDPDVTGFMLEISPIVGSESDLEKNLSLFFNSELPEGAYIQFLLIASHNIEDKLALWRREREKSNNKMIKQLTNYREFFLRERAKDFSSCDGRMGRDFKIYVCCSFFGWDKKKLDNVKNFKKKLYSKFRSLKLSPRICNAEDLIFLAGDIAQMQINYRGRKKFDPGNPISSQILKPLNRTIIEEEAIIHVDQGLITKCFYPLNIPESFSLIEMIELLGSDKEGMSIPARFILSYSLATDINKAGEAKILTKGQRSIHAAEQYYARHDTNLKREALEWREVIARNKNGERFLTECLQVMITSTKDEIQIAEENLRSLYNSSDWQLEVNRNLQLPSMMSILPMQQAMYWQTLKNFGLVKKVQSREVIAKLPIHGEWKGVPKSGVLLLGRRGEMFNWNPYFRVGGGGNFNICVMAPAGSGKSVFLQELATSVMAQDIAVFILDIGASYQNICELVEGESIRFNKESDLSLNPFASLAGSGANYIHAKELIKAGYNIEFVCSETGLSEEVIKEMVESSFENSKRSKDANDIIEILKIGTHYVTKDSIIYSKSIIAAMCGLKGDAHKEAIIEKAITRGIEKCGTDLDITKFTEALRDLEDILIAKEIADTLYPYTEKGIHGRFFKAGRAASFTEMMTVFEFEEVKNDPVLLGVVLQVILMQITMQFLCGDRSRKFMMIVDEAWMILDHCAPFLEAFARTVRKYGGSLVTCVQDLNSFQSGKAQKAIFENSTWKIVLKQTNMESFRECDAFKNFIPLIESVTKEPTGKYSEALIQTSGLIIVGRLVLDPYSVALYSTEQEDFNFLIKCKKEGLNKDEAVKELSKKYGRLPDVSLANQ